MLFTYLGISKKLRKRKANLLTDMEHQANFSPITTGAYEPVFEQIPNHFSLEKVFRTAAAVCRQVAGSEKEFLFLLDEENGEYFIVQQYTRRGDEIQFEVEIIPLDIDFPKKLVEHFQANRTSYRDFTPLKKVHYITHLKPLKPLIKTQNKKLGRPCYKH